MSNTDLMPPLPFLLAGPVVRRVTPQRITLWLATSERPRLFPELYVQGRRLKAAVRSTDAWQLGREARLWVTLLQLEPPLGQTFPLDTVIHYRIYDLEREQWLDLEDVTYPGESMPSFLIPSTLQAMAFGSCRKPHGFSEDDEGTLQYRDSLALLSDEVRQHLTDVERRPALLCLMGDQIYADDVIDPVMDLLRRYVRRLFPHPIDLPGYSLQADPSREERQQMKRSMGLTSDSPYHHLFGFEEYAAMYLYVFGNRLEEPLKPHLDPTQEQLPPLLRLVHRINPKWARRLGEKLGFYEERDREYHKAEESLKGFHDSLREVRRLLANIAVYMIFDDHDVTDDWNLSRRWYDTVRASADGTRVISNALAAYWAFQGWGNDPDRFPERFIRVITDHLAEPDNETRAQMFDFYLWKFHNWHYSIPVSPPIMVLDTRTQRDFAGYQEPPQLLDRYGIDHLRAEWLWFNRKAPVRHTPIIVAPTPVIGYAPIERIQKVVCNVGVFLSARIGTFTTEKLDIESWVANRQGFAFFMTSLVRRMGLRNVVFISGDVHYSFVHRGQFVADQDVLHCVQLTSSAIRNAPKRPKLFARFLSHRLFTNVSGPLYPEKLSWWERHGLWRLLRRPAWRTLAFCEIGQVEDACPVRRTGRSNIGLLHLKDGELEKLCLLSGDRRDRTVVYHF